MILCFLFVEGCSSLQNGFLGIAPFGDKQEYVRARNLYNEQKYEEAVNELTRYIYKAGNVNRREARAYRLLGMSYLAGQAENYRAFGFFSQARNYYDKFFKLNPSASPQYRAKYASTFLNQGNFEQAFIHITMALSEDAYQPDYWLISAKASFGLGRYNDALNAIDTALDLAPDRTDLQLYKIIGLYQTQHYKDSARWARQFIQKNPDNQLGWLLLALNEWKLNQRTSARTHLQKATAFEENSFTGQVASKLLQEWK